MQKKGTGQKPQCLFHYEIEFFQLFCAAVVLGAAALISSLA